MKPDARQIEHWWNDLASEDSRRAYAALWGLSAAPEQTLRLLRDRLRAAPAVTTDKLQKLIGELDSEAFPRREFASEQLAAMGEQAQAALEAALKRSHPSRAAAASRLCSPIRAGCGRRKCCERCGPSKCWNTSAAREPAGC